MRLLVPALGHATTLYSNWGEDCGQVVPAHSDHQRPDHLRNVWYTGSTTAKDERYQRDQIKGGTFRCALRQCFLWRCLKQPSRPFYDMGLLH